MKYTLILLFTVLFFPLQVIANDNDSCKQVANQSDTCCFSRFTDSSAMRLVEKTEQNARQAYLNREEQRNQLMGLTITVLVGIVGFALSKDNKQKNLILGMAFVFCLLMHTLDTSWSDLSNRQLAYSNRLNCYLLQWDSLRVDEKKSALMKICDGNECNDTFRNTKGWERKVCMFLWDGVFNFLWWWGLPFAVLFVRFFDKLETWWKKLNLKKVIPYAIAVAIILLILIVCWRIFIGSCEPEHRCGVTTHTDKHE